MRAVARRVGVTPGAPYHHFKSKAGLMAAVAQDGFAQLADAQTRVLSRGLAADEQLRSLCQAYIDFAVQHPTHYRIMFESSPGERDPDDLPGGLGDRAMSTFITLSQGVAAVSGLRDTHQLRKRTSMVWALAHGAVTLLLRNMPTLLLPGVTSNVWIAGVADACVTIARGSAPSK